MNTSSLTVAKSSYGSQIMQAPQLGTCTTALWKRFWPAGETSKVDTYWAPEDKPQMVTFLASPPKLAMWRCTQPNAHS